MTLQPHQQRVVDELAELEAKYDKLLDFIYRNPLYNDLSGAEQALLVKQTVPMASYIEILTDRVQLFMEKPK